MKTVAQKSLRGSSGSSFVGLRETGIDAVATQIERASRSPFGHRQGGRALIDSEILARFADPDEMLYADQSSRVFSGRFKKSYPDEVLDGQFVWDGEGHEVDFRDGLDGCGCEHPSGCVCIECCTARDLAALPDPSVCDRVNVRMKWIGSKLEEVFDLVFQSDEARHLGLIH